MRSAALAAVAVAGIAAGASVAHADALLEKMVGFTGQVFFIDAKVPAVIIGAVRDGDVAVAGFGERAGPGGPAPRRRHHP
jgi:D-alanyl-D-alanine-carboxypeptidase/D-alanyl-D-alanine-endopeptidase